MFVSLFLFSLISCCLFVLFCLQLSSWLHLLSLPLLMLFHAPDQLHYLFPLIISLSSSCCCSLHLQLLSAACACVVVILTCSPLAASPSLARCMLTDLITLVLLLVVCLHSFSHVAVFIKSLSSHVEFFCLVLLWLLC